jgi:hypothetical protein
MMILMVNLSERGRVLLVEETGEPGENHQPVSIQIYHVWEGYL